MNAVYENEGLSVQSAPRGRLLDVGCGSGRFLVHMRDLGWEVTGVEPDPVAVRVAHRSFHLNVASGTLEDAGFPESCVDVVTMNHVIEHVPDPISSLRECNRVLREGGRLVVVTPNVHSLGHWYFNHSWRGLEVPRHLQLLHGSGIAGVCRAGRPQRKGTQNNGKGSAVCVAR
ncbi:MAG: class I SAM-dependent methyltransferase [bacterium]